MYSYTRNSSAPCRRKSEDKSGSLDRKSEPVKARLHRPPRPPELVKPKSASQLPTHPMVQPQSVSLSFSLKRQASARRSCANNITKARRWFDGKASRFRHGYAAPICSGGLAIRRFRRFFMNFEEHRQRHWRMTAAGERRRATCRRTKPTRGLVRCRQRLRKTTRADTIERMVRLNGRTPSSSSSERMVWPIVVGFCRACIAGGGAGWRILLHQHIGNAPLRPSRA